MFVNDSMRLNMDHKYLTQFIEQSTCFDYSNEIIIIFIRNFLFEQPYLKTSGYKIFY